MKKLIVLGTGNATVTKCYNTCFAMTKDDQEYFLTDAGGGNGILSALEDTNIPLNRIHHMFVSHAHNDHILGVVWIIRMAATLMNKGSYEGTLTIYCHQELESIIKTLTCLTVGKKMTRHLDERIIFRIVQDRETLTILDQKFTFFDIQSTKEKQFGYVLETDEGKTICFPGDEPIRDFMLPYAENCDWLFHEAFCLYDQRDIFKPYEKHHSTVKDVCELAEKMQIPNVVLWHTEDRNIADRQKLYHTEGAAYYKGNLLIPEDHDVIEL